MTIQDRLLELLASFAQVDANSIRLNDMIREEDGGLLDEDEMYAFLDEAEGQFDIEIGPLDLEEVTTVEDLLDYLAGLIEERMMAGPDY